jgi:hypothetical protein
MASRIDLPSAFPTMDRAARRSAVWLVFQRTLNGPPGGGNVAGLEPGEFPDTEIVGSLSRTQLVARPYALRRLIAPLVLARDDPDWNSEFRELVIAAVSDQPSRPMSFPDALRWLRDWGRQRFAVEPRGALVRGVRAGLRLLDPEATLQVEPTMLMGSNGIFTVGRRAWVKAPLRAITSVLDPVNWMSMGEFFDYVGQVEGTVTTRPDGWHGLFEERFVTDWGPIRLSTCHPILNVDFTFDEARVRADYSLRYEENDQLVCDDGYLEATSLPGWGGWCEYYAEKSTRFRSPSTNLLAPSVMAVFLESNLSSIEDAAYDYLDAQRSIGAAR